MTHITLITLITGGGRSGKSARALFLAETYRRKVFIATTQANDTQHQTKHDPNWTTIEEPLALAEALAQVADPNAAIVIDCLTDWLRNLISQNEEITEDAPRITAFLHALRSASAAHIIIVTNEVGMGIIPADAQTQRWRDAAGHLNQCVAALADEVALMVCGYPVAVKPTEK